MAVNKDGLEPGKPVDFETLQRVKQQQREAKRNGTDAKPERKQRGKARGSKVRQSDESVVQGVADPEEPQGAE